MNKLKLSLIIIGAIIFLAGSNTLTWYLTKCDPSGTIEVGEPGPLSPTDWKDNKPAAKYCGPRIDIEGAMREGKFFVTSWDNCKSNFREFPMTAICPPLIRPYSIQLQLFMLAGYDRDQKRFNALAGGTAAFLWNYNLGSIGLGITYAQSIMYKAYYAGASVIAQDDFGKRRN